MACCGERRRSLSQTPKRPTTATAPAVKSQSAVSQQPQRQTQAAAAPILLQYVGKANVVVQGSATGRKYPFSGVGSVRPVDARDAVILLRSSTEFIRG